MENAMNKVIQRTLEIGITVPREIIEKEVRGIYGFFGVDDNNNAECFYIGRSYNIRNRLFDAKGHFKYYFHYLDELDAEGWKQKKKSILVPQLIKKCFDENKKLEIRVLKRVPYKGDNYNRDMQRLAYAEICEIEKAQKRGECMHQLPEGTWISEEIWNEKYKKTR